MTAMKRRILKETFRDKVFLSNLWSLAMPIALQSLMLSLVGASDTIMLGALDQNSMASVSLATQLQFVQNLTVSGIIAAFTVLGAQYAGKEDRKSVDMLFSLTSLLCLVVSVLTFALCFFTPELVMRIFTNEEVLITLGVDYLRRASFSYLLVGFSQCLLSRIKLQKNTASVARISAVTVGLNIVLNALFIFGLFGFPREEIVGAATATLISRIVELLLSLFVAMKKDVRPRAKYLFSFSPLLTRDYIRQLIPLLGAYLVWTIGITSYSAFLGHMGVDAAAANSLSQTVRNLTQSFTRGLAGGSGILIGYELGSGNLERAREYGDRLSLLSLLCGILTALLVIAFIPLSPLVVELTPKAMDYFTEISFILALYVIGAAYNSVVINGMFASGGDTYFDFYSICVVMWGFAVPLAAAGTFLLGWPVAAVYFCTCLDEVGKIPWTLHHYRKYRWVKDLTR